MKSSDTLQPDGSADRQDLPETLKSSFAGVVLVCGDCEERGSGPRKFGSKDVRKRLKDALRPAKGRLRVAVTGCLGPCPKKAMTVAVVAGGVTTMKALCRADQADSVGADAIAALSRASSATAPSSGLGGALAAVPEA